MADTFQISATTTRYTVNIRPGEVVLRGTVIAVHAAVKLSPDAVRGVAVADQRLAVERTDDGKTVRLDSRGTADRLSHASDRRGVGTGRRSAP
jgi:hypothetical protein